VNFYVFLRVDFLTIELSSIMCERDHWGSHALELGISLLINSSIGEGGVVRVEARKMKKIW